MRTREPAQIPRGIKRQPVQTDPDTSTASLASKNAKRPKKRLKQVYVVDPEPHLVPKDRVTRSDKVPDTNKRRRRAVEPTAVPPVAVEEVDDVPTLVNERLAKLRKVGLTRSYDPRPPTYAQTS